MLKSRRKMPPSIQIRELGEVLFFSDEFETFCSARGNAFYHPVIRNSRSEITLKNYLRTAFSLLV